MYNINRNDSYLKVRSLRHDARTSNQLVSGIELAEGLEKYSAPRSCLYRRTSGNDSLQQINAMG